MVAPLPHTVALPAYVPKPSETEAPLAFPAPPTVYAGIPATFPISLSQITAEFGGNSLLTAAPAAGLSAPVSISSFAGKSANQGSGSFGAGYYSVWNGVGFSIVFVIFGTTQALKFCNGDQVAGFWQLNGGGDLTIYAYGTSPNTNALFHNVTINGVKLYRSQAAYSYPTCHQWTWSGVPAVITNGQNYTPIWRTS